jgi:hypothetical protein
LEEDYPVASGTPFPPKKHDTADDEDSRCGDCFEDSLLVDYQLEYSSSNCQLM